MASVLPVDFKSRRSMHQTMRDRKNLHGTALSVAEHEKRMLRTEFAGGCVLGFLWGVGLCVFFGVLFMWVSVGGAP